MIESVMMGSFVVFFCMAALLLAVLVIFLFFRGLAVLVYTASLWLLEVIGVSAFCWIGYFFIQLIINLSIVDKQQNTLGTKVAVFAVAALACGYVVYHSMSAVGIRIFGAVGVSIVAFNLLFSAESLDFATIVTAIGASALPAIFYKWVALIESDGGAVVDNVRRPHPGSLTQADEEAESYRRMREREMADRAEASARAQAEANRPHPAFDTDHPAF